MPTVTVKLSESDAELLEKLREGSKSKSDVIRELLHSAEDVISGNTEDIEYYKRQNEELLKALNNALEISKAAQVLQAAAEPKKLLDEPGSRWQRFKRAIFGEGAEHVSE